jgi:hypothetical protein
MRKELGSTESSLAMTLGSFHTLLMTRAGQHLETSFQKEQPRVLTPKRASFPSFGPSTESTVSLTFRGRADIIKHFSMIKLYQV